MKLNKKYLIIVSTLLLILVSTIIGITYAKYIAKKDVDKGIYSENFYFTVDVLGDTLDYSDLSAEYDFYGGYEKTIIFNVQNYFDDLRITNKQIDYNVSLSISNSATASLSRTSGSLVGGTKNKQAITLNINDGYTEGTKFIVTISSTSPYVKTMTLTFVLHTYDAEVKYYINDDEGRAYAELVLTSNVKIDVQKLLIDYSAINTEANILQVDITNHYILNNNGGVLTTETNDLLNSGSSFYKKITNTVAINAGEAVSIIFFKSDKTKNYIVGETTVVKNGDVFEIILG